MRKGAKNWKLQRGAKKLKTTAAAQPESILTQQLREHQSHWPEPIKVVKCCFLCWFNKGRLYIKTELKAQVWSFSSFLFFFFPKHHLHHFHSEVTRFHEYKNNKFVDKVYSNWTQTDQREAPNKKINSQSLSNGFVFSSPALSWCTRAARLTGSESFRKYPFFLLSIFNISLPCHAGSSFSFLWTTEKKESRGKGRSKKMKNVCWMFAEYARAGAAPLLWHTTVWSLFIVLYRAARVWNEWIGIEWIFIAENSLV